MNPTTIARVLVYLRSRFDGWVLSADGAQPLDELAEHGSAIEAWQWLQPLPREPGLWIWEGVARAACCELDPPIAQGEWRRLRTHELMRVGAGLDPFRDDDAVPIFPLRKPREPEDAPT